jgi:pilus assembly protein CpaE
MAGTVVLGCADQTLAYELRAQLVEAVSDLTVLGVAESTTELTALVTQHDPNLVLVHDQLGPEPVHQVIRDLSLRRPASVSVVVASDNDAEALAAAMDAGARGVLTYPLAFSEVQQRVVNALEWSAHMASLLAASGAEGGARGRATVLAMTGSKGGVGTTTLATHLCWDVKRELPHLKVLLVDLDLEKGDVTSLIEARYRTSVADLAKVAQDLSPRTVADAVFEHESGLHLLLPPEDVREVELVTPAAIRQILSVLRQQYDLVVVDVGAHVTPVQAAVVEIADEVVSVVTPDLVSLRALRRNLGWWESLAVRKPEAVHVLLNRSSRIDEVQPETARRLSPAPMLSTVIGDMGRKLESATNSRTPLLVDDASWWKSLRALGREIGVVRQVVAADASARALAEAGAPSDAEASRRRRGRPAGDEGQSTIETVALLPVLAVVLALMWQLGLTAYTYVWTGHAASGAARSVAMGETDAQVRASAEDRMPSWMRPSMRVLLDPSDPSEVTVRVAIPAVVPGVFASSWDAVSSNHVVREP